MHHTLAWTASIAQAADVDTAALADGIVQVQNGHFLFQSPKELWAIAAMSANLQRGRIVSPTYRQVTLPQIRPINVGVTPLATPRVADFRERPLTIRMREELQVDLRQGGVAAERATAIGIVGWGPMVPVPNGEIYTWRHTSTTAVTANAWSLLTSTPDDVIPVGRYAVVGLEVQSTNAIAARLVFEDQYPRPGSVSITGIGDWQHPMFTKGGLGVWGFFESVRTPSVEVLANGADASHEIRIDIIRVGGGPSGFPV